MNLSLTLSICSKELFKQIASSFITLALAFVLFTILLRATDLFGVKILFYKGIVSVFVAAIVTLLFDFFIQYILFRSINFWRAIALASLSFGVLVAFLVIFPVSLDRSISVFMIGYLNNTDVPMTVDNLTDVFVNVYVLEYNGMERRIQEQVSSGNISCDVDGFCELTEQGRQTAELFKDLAKLFSIDDMFVDPKIK